MHWLLAGLALAIGAGALAQVVPGGLPSFVSFRALTVNSTSGRACPGQGHNNTTSACFTTSVSGHSNWSAVISPQGGSGNELGLFVDGGTSALASSDTIFRVDGGNIGSALQVTGDGSVTQQGFDANVRDSGAVTITFATAQMPNCTGTGTNTNINFHKIGKVVTGLVSANATCTTTGGTTNVQTNNTPVPAGFRPATSTTCGAALVTTSVNPGGQMGDICVTTTGNLQIFTVPTTGSTSIGTIGLATFTYTLD
jgi:hypothetical protein